MVHKSFQETFPFSAVFEHVHSVVKSEKVVEY
jgi:hypothetical protein